jgi:hypothetical protein
MTTYTEPKTEDLARLAAEAMGWKLSKEFFEFEESSQNVPSLWHTPQGKIVKPWEWHPETSHDHAQILVDEAFKRGIEKTYIDELLYALRGTACCGPFKDLKIMAKADPESKVRAFLRAIHESKQ